jgi:hypothetical protein
MIRDEILEREIERTNKIKSDVDELARREQPSRIMQAWGNLVSSYQTLPGLRGLWSASVYDGTNIPILKEMVGRTNRDLTTAASANRVAMSYEGFIPRAGFATAQSRYISCASLAELNVRGLSDSDGNPGAAFVGLTFGGWFQPLVAGEGVDQTYIGKYNTTGNQRSYQIRKSSSSNTLSAFISSDGIATTQSPESAAVTFDNWHFIIGRFVPSTSLDIFLNNTKSSNTTSIPASIFASTADFVVGARNNGGANFADMRAAIWFVCAQQLSDDIINGLWHQGRKLFGV